MKLRLFWTIVFAFALVIGLSVCGMLGFVGLSVAGVWRPVAMRDSFQEAQQSYVQMLGDYYVAHGNSWAGIDQRLDSTLPIGPLAGVGRYVVADSSGRVVAANDRRQLGQIATASQLARGTPIKAGNLPIGTLLQRLDQDTSTNRFPEVRPPPAFFWPVLRSFLIAGIFLATVLLLVAVVFARRISRPLRDLTLASQQLAAGQLHVQVGGAPIRELDELAQTFNAMARSLEQADRQRRQLTADIAHELRTPLTIIKGRLEGLQDGVYEPTASELDRLLSETALLERLIEDLRLLALAEAGQLPLYREQIDPRDLLHAAQSAFTGQAAQQGIALLLHAPDQLPVIDADPQRMAQVLANLITNALRYTPAGGTITLSACAACEVPSAETKAPTTEAQNAVTIAVSDSGQGIDADDLPHIFDRFYRADRSRARGSGGTGLGLAITRQIVVAHGGTIAADSTPGQGTTISVTLPAAGEE